MRDENGSVGKASIQICGSIRMEETLTKQGPQVCLTLELSHKNVVFKPDADKAWGKGETRNGEKAFEHRERVRERGVHKMGY